MRIEFSASIKLPALGRCSGQPAGDFGYNYDSTQLQRVTQLNLPNYISIINQYDNVARLTSTKLMTDHYYVNADSYAYGYNQANQRTNVVRAAGDYVNYTYDNMGELTSSTGYESSGIARSIDYNKYQYDAAGNLSFRKITPAVYGSTLYFTVNQLNQITNSSFPAGPSGLISARVTGSTTSPATGVTVNGYTATLYGDKSFLWFPSVPRAFMMPGLNTFTAIATDAYGRRSTNVSTVNIVPTDNAYAYDLNGNLLTDGTRNFGYDDENQLIAVWKANTWSNNFVYDGKMRRRVAREYAWSGSAWLLTSETRFIYDGNLVVQERNANNLPQVTYTRGQDLSGTLQGAGGIGGLLARTDNTQPTAPSPTPAAHAFYHSDGNGNITCLVYPNGQIAAKYLYDPFGNMLAQSGTLAEANTYRFSSKEWNQNSGLYYYLYRFYDPNLQRWVNRDPIGEMGGVNLYEMSANNPIDRADLWGLMVTAPSPNPIRSTPRPTPFPSPGRPPIRLPLPPPGPLLGVPIAIGAGCGIAYGMITCGTDADRNPGGVNCWNNASCQLPKPEPKCPLPNEPSPDKSKAQRECIDRVSQYDEAVRRRGDPPLTRQEKKDVYNNCMAEKGFPVPDN